MTNDFTNEFHLELATKEINVISALVSFTQYSFYSNKNKKQQNMNFLKRNTRLKTD